MAWDGWLEYGGTEIINVARTEAYARNAKLGWFKPVFGNDALPVLLGETYGSPLVDDAPWTDPRDPDSYDFYGVYPLEVGGIEDSTWQASVIENTGDGGVVGRIRKGTRTVVFNVALIGLTECAVEMGMRWLRSALGGRPCLGPVSTCGGHDMCYLRCEPDLDWNAVGESTTVFNTTTDWVGSDPWVAAAPWGTDGTYGSVFTYLPFDPQDCLDGFTRTLRQVTFTVGPTITRKNVMTDDGCAWIVTFTATAADPYEWGQEEPLVKGFMDPAVPVPYVGGTLPDGASYDDVGVAAADGACPAVAYDPVFDPECPLLIPPAGLPIVDLVCFDFPATFTRRQFTIPADRVPIWGDVVPLLTIRTPDYEVRNMRIRFYADVNGTADPSQDPCSYCGDMTFTYIPANSTLVFDASDRLVYLEAINGDRRRAESLVFGEGGVPFEWPALTCGLGFVVTVDLPDDQEPPALDLAMFARVA